MNQKSRDERRRETERNRFTDGESVSVTPSMRSSLMFSQSTGLSLPVSLKPSAFPWSLFIVFFPIPLFLHFLHPSFPPPLHQLLSTPSHSTASICLYVLLISPCCSCHLLFTHAWMIVRTLLYLCHISHTVSLLFLLIFFFPPMCFLFLPVLHLLVNVHLCGVCFLKQVSPCSSFPNYLQN